MAKSTAAKAVYSLSGRKLFNHLSLLHLRCSCVTHGQNPVTQKSAQERLSKSGILSNRSHL